MEISKLIARCINEKHSKNHSVTNKMICNYLMLTKGIEVHCRTIGQYLNKLGLEWSIISKKEV